MDHRPSLQPKRFFQLIDTPSATYPSLWECYKKFWTIAKLLLQERKCPLIHHEHVHIGREIDVIVIY